MKVLPDGFWPLLAPAAPLPAPLLIPLLVPLVVPFVEEPVVTPLVADPVAAELPRAEPLPCANANVLVNASAAANPIVLSLMVVSAIVTDPRQTAARLTVPSVLEANADVICPFPQRHLAGLGRPRRRLDAD
jgi:hypothetical protein